MTTPFDTAKNAVLGVPFDENKKPTRQGIVQAFSEMQEQIEGFQSGALIRDTLSNLQSLNTVSATSLMAWVVGDPVEANNGIYENTGTASTPSWTRRTDIPQFIISAMNVGDGTANAILADTDLPIPSADGRCMVLLPIDEDNTGATTVSFNSGSVLPIKSISGADVLAGSLLAGMVVSGFIANGNFRLTTDIASASIVTQAESARDAAIAAVASAAVYDGRYFDTVVTLAADATMTYTPAQAGSVAAGEYIYTRSEAVSYIVAASGATDANLTTAGGVKLYEAGYTFSTIANFKAAIARGDTFRSGDTVSVAKYRLEYVGAPYVGGPNGMDGFKPVGFIDLELFGAVSLTAIEPQTRAWYDEMTVKPTTFGLRAMDQLVRDLLYSGLWDKIGCLWEICGHVKSEIGFDIKNPTVGRLTDAGTTTFNAGKGIDATTGYYTTGGSFSFANVPNYALDDASIGVFMVASDGAPNPSDNSPAFGINASDSCYIAPLRSSEDEMRFRVNTDTSVDVDHPEYRNGASGLGHFCAVRDASGTSKGFVRGQNFETVVSTSTAIPTGEIRVGNVTGSDASGNIAFVHAGQALNDYEVRMLSWILDDYRRQISGLYDQGDVVTDALLDVAVDVTVNTAAINKAFAFSSLERRKIVSNNPDYLVNDTIIGSSFVDFEGVEGLTRFRAVAEMTNIKCVLSIGEAGRVVISPKISGLIVDYNPERWSETTGGVSDASDGDAIAWINTKGGDLEGVEGWASRRHAVNAVSESFNRSETDGVFNQRTDLVCKLFNFNRVTGYGFGDDGVTFHGCHDFYYDKCGGRFGRGTFVKNNNGVETDDECENFRGGYVWAQFCSGLEIKGHGDAMAARRGSVVEMHTMDCAVIRIRHINRLDPEDSGSPSGAVPFVAADIEIGLLRVEDPVIVIRGEAGVGDGVESVDADLFQIYGLKNVGITKVSLRAGKGVLQAVDATGKIFYGASNVNIGNFEAEGFNKTTNGLFYGDSATGLHTIGVYTQINGPSGKALFAGDDLDFRLVIGGHNIQRTVNAENLIGDTGIFGYGSRVVTNGGFVQGYTTDVDVTN